MQVANALNNNIRILFNPRVEAFKLFDFLIVKSDSDRYLAQIIEIYDDKFDASQNVAKIKLFYKIAQNDEVMPYDNFTPNKECEIIKIKQEDIEEFINDNKKTFIFGTNAKSSTSLSVKYDFFNKNCIILADKVEQANCISHNLAKNLSSEKNVVIIDSTGIIEFEGAKKIKASKNFKMPLNYTTINYIFQKCLADASLEFQAMGSEILNEIKKFARKQENEFIPFNAFTRVLMEQYKVTPYVELKLLLARLKKCQMDEIFARNKKDVDALFKAIEKNPITIVDLSSIDSSWQKAYLKYIISDIEQEIYLISRVNEENCDTDLLTKIYCQKQNISFIPNVSYNYKKLPTLLQYCKNYILMPSLFQRADFLDANFALSNLISDGCILFGEDTDNFLYLAKDYELAMQEQRKNYRKIALTLVQNDEEEIKQNLGEKGDYFENKQNQNSAHSQKLIEELSNFEKIQLEKEESEESFEEIENPIQEVEEETIENEEVTEIASEEIENEDFDSFKEESQDEFQDILDGPQESLTKKSEPETEDYFKKETDENKVELDDLIAKSQAESKEEAKEENEEKVSEEEKEETEEKEEDSLNKEMLSFAQVYEEENEEKTEEIQEDEDDSDEISEAKEEEEMGFSDEELDFFQLAKETSFENQQPAVTKVTKEETKTPENIVVDNVEYKTSNEDEDEITIEEEQNKEEDEEIDLSEVANKSIDSNFEQIINTKSSQNSQTINIDENTKININKLENSSNKENLPIFKEEINDEDSQEYSIGDSVIHKTYGRGKVIGIKMNSYEKKQLLQIEFEEVGKKLLDPEVANLLLES